MATDRYSIQVDTASAVKSVESLKGALGALAAAVSVRELIGFADSITSVRNRLAQLSPTTAGVEASFKGIAAIAISARAPLEATADLYFRIAKAADGLGISQRDAAQVTELVAKSLTASGISAQEAAGPLMQLGQALQSGTLQGDEFRSVLEGMPPVAKAIATSMNVPVGALKKLASEGKISARTVIDAIKGARAQIEADFGRTSPTIGQAFTNLKTQAALAFSEFENNTQTARGVANAIEYLGFAMFKLSKNIDDVIGPLTTFIKVGLAIALFNPIVRLLTTLWRGIAAIGTAWRAAGSAAELFRKNLVALPYSITPATSAFGKFLVYVRAFLNVIKPLKDAILGAGAAFLSWVGAGEIIDFLKGLGDEANKNTDDWKAYQEELAKMKEGFDDTAGAGGNFAANIATVRTELQKSVDAYSRQTDAARRQIETEIEMIGLSEERKTALGTLKEIETDYLNTVLPLIDQYKKLKGSSNKDEQAAADAMVPLLQKLEKEYNNQVGSVQKLTEARTQANRELQLNLFRTQSITEANQKLRDLQYEIATALMPELEKKYNDILQAQRNSAYAAIAAEEQRRGSLLTDQEKLRYLDAATQKTKELQDATLELNKREAQRRQNIFVSQEMTNAAAEYRDILHETAKLTMTDIEKKEADILHKARQRAEAEIAAEEALRGTKLSEQERAVYINKSVEATQRLVQATRENYDASRSFMTGWKQALNEYVDETENAAKQAQRIFERATQGMEDAIVEFAKTGKFEFKGFINSILEDLLRSQVRQLIGQLFGAMSGGSSGSGGGSLILGAIGSVGKLLGFANGGIIPTNGPVIVGERGPEILAGARGMNVIPNEQLGGATYVTYNIQAVDATSFKQLVARDPSFIHAVAEQGRKSVPQTRR